MGVVIPFRPARDPRDRWPTIHVEPAPGGWWAHEVSASGDSGVLIAATRTKAEALRLARAARRRDYRGAAHLEVAPATQSGGAA